MRHVAMWGATLVSAAVAVPAWANDSSSELAAGGIVLTKTDAIAMRREDLTLSPREVRVRYEMRNDTGKPFTLRVAFPLPEVPKETPGGMSTTTGEGNIDMKVPTQPNFIGFRVWANGAAVMPEADVHATLADGRDITAELRTLGGWPLILHPRLYEVPAGRPGAPKTWDLDDATRRRLREIGALTQDDDSYDTQWTTRITFHWKQVFAPGITVIEHAYRPILGVQLAAPMARTGDTTRIDPAHGKWGGSEDLETNFCIDAATRAALDAVYRAHMRANAAARQAPHDPADDYKYANTYLTAYRLAYVLTTARNWSGPIGIFHLTLNGGAIGVPHGDGDDAAVMSLCTDLTLRQTARMRFEATARNYVPAADLHVLLVPR